MTSADGEGSSPPALRRSDSFAMDEDFEEDEQLMIIGGGGGGHSAVTAARSNTPLSSATGRGKLPENSDILNVSLEK